MNALRTAEVARRTAETEVKLKLCIDGRGGAQISTGVGFFDHMLVLFARHSLFDLEIDAAGDLHVDAHHTVEDVAICLGRALRDALGEKAGISRFGHALIPMDEALALAAADLSGRGYLAFSGAFPKGKTGDFDLELVEEFLRALAANGEFTLHVRLLAGKNSHHACEAVFKAVARALREAVSFDDRQPGVPSTKGVL
jgi:imidazoleglycerol-phosphate dehydratase